MKRLYFYLTFLYRYITSFKRKLPDFIIIGEAKCGTTSLFRYIMENSRCEPPIKKEIHYFDYKYNKGIKWYKAHYPLIKKNTLTGEATPYYFYHPKSFYRIKETIPNVKLILMVRNPIERAISSYFNQRKLDLEHIENFHEAVEIEPVRLKNTADEIFTKGDFNYNHKYYSYLTRGKYYANLVRFLTLFDKDKILILEYEEFFSDLDKQYQKVIEFLELNAQEIKPIIYNKGNYKINISSEERKKLQSFFCEDNKKFFQLIGKRYIWK